MYSAGIFILYFKKLVFYSKFTKVLFLFHFDDFIGFSSSWWCSPDLRLSLLRWLLQPTVSRATTWGQMEAFHEDTQCKQFSMGTIMGKSLPIIVLSVWLMIFLYSACHSNYWWSRRAFPPNRLRPDRQMEQRKPPQRPNLHWKCHNPYQRRKMAANDWPSITGCEVD